MNLLKKINSLKITCQRVVPAIVLAIVTSYILRNYLTLVLFEGKDFSGRNTLLKFALLGVYTAIFFVIYLMAISKVKHPFTRLKNRPQQVTTDFQRLYLLLFVLIFAVALISFLNNIFPMIHTGDLTFGSFRYFYYMSPVGGDFRNGIYQPPKVFLEGGGYYLAYPPFTNVFFMPLQLFNENTAYLIEVFLLLAANILSLILSSIIVRDTLFRKLALEKNTAAVASLILVAAFGWFTLSSYSFVFSVERGNYDAIAILFGVASIFLMLKKPESIWGQVILLSIATHLKLYPAALFVVLFILHRKKLILPTLVVNTLMLFSLGFRNGLKFISLIIAYTQDPALGPYNHSGYGYAQVLYKAFPDFFSNINLLRIGLIIIPIILWVFTCYLIVKHLKNGTRYAYLLMVTIPLMCIVPTVSHDYKLVIISPAILMLFSLILFKISHRLKITDFLQLLILFGFMYLIGRTYALFSPSLSLISNKYPVIVGLMLSMLFNIRPLKRILDQIDAVPVVTVKEKPETREFVEPAP